MKLIYYNYTIYIYTALYKALQNLYISFYNFLQAFSQCIHSSACLLDLLPACFGLCQNQMLCCLNYGLFSCLPAASPSSPSPSPSLYFSHSLSLLKLWRREAFWHLPAKLVECIKLECCALTNNKFYFKQKTNCYRGQATRIFIRCLSDADDLTSWPRCTWPHVK